MGEPFAAVVTTEWLLARMYAHVLLQVMLEFERLITVGAFELTQQRRFVVRDHMTLETVNVGKLLVAYLAAHQSIRYMHQLMFLK